MRMKQLGRSGIKVSEMCLGCWPFAGGDVWGHQEDADSIAAVHRALDSGVNFFDTAEGYGGGRSEEALGRAVNGRRDRAVIATKVSPNHLDSEGVVAACERSLTRLGTDYIDLYLIHWPNREVPIAETMDSLDGLVQGGKVRALGVCNFGALDLGDLLEVAHIEVNQLPYSLLWRPIEHDILPKCREREIGLMTYSPLMQGLLTGRYQHADEVPAGIARTRLFAASRPQAVHGESGMEGELFEVLEGYRALCQRLGSPMAHVALTWVRQQRGVTSVLVGARSAAEVDMNLAAFDMALTDEVIRELDDLTDDIKRNLGTSPDLWSGENRMR